MISTVLEFNSEIAGLFGKEVMERSGQNLYACYQCKRCASGCPAGEDVEYVTPDRLIRNIIMGDREKALNNLLVWKCVSCYTCGTRCPNNIHSSRITETLKKMSKESHLKPLRPKVFFFHDTFIKNSLRWGRVNELEFMGLFQIMTSLNVFKKRVVKPIIDEIIEQAKFGLSMVKKKRLHPGFQTSKGRHEIRRLFKKENKKWN
mgnify:CR=1 FL=1